MRAWARARASIRLIARSLDWLAAMLSASAQGLTTMDLVTGRTLDAWYPAPALAADPASVEAAPFAPFRPGDRERMLAAIRDLGAGQPGTVAPFDDRSGLLRRCSRLGHSRSAPWTSSRGLFARRAVRASASRSAIR